MRSPPGALCEIQKRHREHHRTRKPSPHERLSQVQYCRRATRPNVSYGSPKLHHFEACKDIIGAAIADIAISIRGRFAGASHVSEIDGTPRSVIHRPWDRVDAGIWTGHKTPCFGYACAAMVGCFVGSTFASWSEA